MKAKFLSLVKIGLTVFLTNLLLTGLLSAQSAPAAVKREIGKQLSCDQRNERVEVVNVGPRKQGFIGYCYGGGEAVVYEKMPRGVNRIFSGETQMNGSIQLGKTAAGGYFDILIEGHGASYSATETFRWTGSRYASVKCESCDLDENGRVIRCGSC